MKTRRIATLGVVVATGAMVMTGCALPYQSEVVEGTEITTSYNENFFSYNSLSSAGNNTANGNVTYMTTEGFSYYDNTPELQWKTDYGTFEKTGDEPLTTKWTINSAVKWSDGVETDEADMLLAWAAFSGHFNEELGDGAFAPASTSGYDLITEVPEVSDHTITFVFSQPYVDYELISPAPNLAAHAVMRLAFPGEYDDDAQAAKDALVEAIQNDDTETLAKVADVWNNSFNYTEMPTDENLYLSNGPYILSALTEDYVTVTANEDYTWGPSPKYESITIRTIADSTAALQALQNGDIEIWTGQPTADILQLAEGIDNAQTQTGEQASYEHVDLTFNNGGPFDPATYGGDADKALKVRQAFLLAFPRQEIVDKIIKPLNPEATLRDSQLVVPGSPAYDAVTEGNDSDYYATTDVDAAKALLEEAGVETPIEVGFWYPEGNVRRQQEFQIIQAAEALAGFTLVDQSEPNWEFTDPSLKPVNPHDATIFAWSSTSLAVAGSDQIFKGYTDPLQKAGNYNGYSNPAVDEALATLAVTSDPDEQVVLQTEIEKALFDDAYGLPIFQFPGLWVNADTVEGVTPMPLSPDYFWNFWEWTPVSATAE